MNSHEVEISFNLSSPSKLISNELKGLTKEAKVQVDKL
jgi:hypothetical protein